MCDEDSVAQDQNRLPCTFCGVSLKNKASLSRHLRTSCKVKPPDVPAPLLQCQDCDRSFKTLIGLSQHRRQAHKEAYNQDALNEVRASKAGKTYILWPPVTITKMATLEASYKGNQVLNFLASKFPDRTKDAISCRRRRNSYKELVAELRNLADPNNQSPPTSLPTTPGSPLVDTITISLKSPSPKASTSSTGHMSPSLKLDFEKLAQSPALPNEAPLWSPCPNPYLSYCKSLADDPESGLFEIDRSLALSALERDLDLHKSINEWFDLVFPISNTKSRTKFDPSNRKEINTRPEKYRYTQHLFNINTARCAKEIIDGSLGAPPLRPSTDAIRKHYFDIFSNPGPNSLPEAYASDGPEWAMDPSPLSTGEVQRALDSTKSTSRGPDNISINNIRETHIDRITFIFNLLLGTSYIPPRIKLCRTTLIPKGPPSEDVTNWRPITISSNVLKTLNRIVLHRLSSIPLNHCQRGFSNIDGCLGSNLLLHDLIRYHRDRAAPHAFLSIDISKAFDTVPHDAIRRALNRFKIPEAFRDLIMESYRGVHTTVSAGGECTDLIPLLRGVKQGDPLSPTLFNLVIDELFCSLPRDAGLHLPSGHPVPALAYADDVILLSNNRKGADILLSATATFFHRLGMRINTRKCSSLECVRVPRKKKLAIITDLPFEIDGTPIASISPSELLKYLGMHFGFQGVTLPSLTELKIGLDNIKKAALKPHQKLLILKTYLLPKFHYGFQNPKISGQLLRAATRLVRTHVRNYLHLPKTSTSAFLHSSARDGGLGVTDFLSVIPSILLRRLDNLRMNGASDPALSEVLAGRMVTQLRRRLLNILGSGNYSKTSVAASWRLKLENSVSGNGLHQGSSSKYTNTWITRPPPFWSGREYVKAIALRGNLLPTVGIVSNPPNERRCRAGCPRQETLCHVLQRCPATHLERIKRHDYIVHDLHKLGARYGWNVVEEPHFRTSDGLLRKPDLLFMNNDKIIISDVQVVWEGPRPIAAAFQSKLNYYSQPELISTLFSKFPGKSIYIIPFVIGARGTWSNCSNKLPTALNIPSSAARDLILRAISGSLRIHESFARSVWARR